MERTNPLFEPTAAGVPASGRDGVDGDEDARRRARAGGTLASAVELRTDGTARGARDRCVFARVDEGGTSVRWGEARGAADETRMNRMCAFANVSRVERRGDGLVVRLMKRDGDVVELTGRDVGEAALWERGLASLVREYAEKVGSNQALEAVEDDGAPDESGCSRSPPRTRKTRCLEVGRARAVAPRARRRSCLNRPRPRARVWWARTTDT